MLTKTLAALMALAAAFVLPATAAEPAKGTGFHEFVVGSPKAKVTVIEYASLTCPHCAHFQTTTYPQIKKAYIDTGKIRFVMRDFPLDQLAMVGAMISRCAAPDKGHKFMELLFQNQQTWATSQKPIEPLNEFAKQAGISEAEVEACLKNESLFNELKAEHQKASTLYSINATPAFFIGDEDLQGDRGFEAMAEVIERQLKKAK